MVQAPQSPRPIVSVVMANHNGAAFLAGALVSAQGQSLREIEIIVCDDASSDDSVELVTAMMEEDPRIRLVRGEVNRGPGAARNMALTVARGKWLAVMDGDDLMHPDRLERLVLAAEADGADIVADDLVMFHAEGPEPSRRFLSGKWSVAPFWVDAHDYVRLNRFYGPGPALGYLKPLFKASLFAGRDTRYDESLRIAEDFDLALRLLMRGARLRVYPDGLYYYRRHRASTSHRLNESAITALIGANRRLLDEETGLDRRMRAALTARQRSLSTALAYERLLTALKKRNGLSALGIALASPRTLGLLRMPLALRLRRLLPGRERRIEQIEVKWEAATNGNCEVTGR